MPTAIPLTRLFVAPIGGLTEVGLSDDEHYLFVTSSDGRGLFELPTGVRIARDREIPTRQSAWLNEPARLVQGIGPLASQWLSVVGLWGGSLPVQYQQWRVQSQALKRRDIITITNDHTRVEQQVAEVITELRAFGFSRSGRYLIIASSSDVEVFSLP